MNDVKHTPGPWFVCGDGDCSCKTVSCCDHPIATIVSGKWGDDFPSIRLTGSSLDRRAEAYMELVAYGSVEDDAAKANARLISAAPDLLEALKNIENDDCRIPSTIWGLVIAAIAKAEGRT